MKLYQICISGPVLCRGVLFVLNPGYRVRSYLDHFILHLFHVAPYKMILRPEEMHPVVLQKTETVLLFSADPHDSRRRDVPDGTARNVTRESNVGSEVLRPRNSNN